MQRLINKSSSMSEIPAHDLELQGNGSAIPPIWVWRSVETPFHNLPKAVNFHLVKPCNFRCKFCFATFSDVDVKMGL
ncbi:MAG: hypothetical protein RMM53_13695, partial [Bacteroidia bacterium]|nr:hypothetical protein [Bacteroidia bacterium]